MLAFLHGGWDTIVMALMFWAFVFGAPIAAVALTGWFLYRRYFKRSSKEEKFPSWR